MDKLEAIIAALKIEHETIQWIQQNYRFSGSMPLMLSTTHRADELIKALLLYEPNLLSQPIHRNQGEDSMPEGGQDDNNSTNLPPWDTKKKV